VNWPCRGKRRVDKLQGYYFETDWGLQHNRLPSLSYIQMYDFPNVLTDLDPKGWVSVKVTGAYNKCVFVYDYSRSSKEFQKRAARMAAGSNGSNITK
jgi:hypothetical protein